MKKTILFLAAALALAACTKTAEIPEGTSDGKALKFRLAVNTPTKSGEAFAGNNASDLSGKIMVFASTHKADGSVFQKSIYSNSDGRCYPGYFYHENGSGSGSGVWSLQDGSGNKFQFLLDGTHLNLVAIAGTEGIAYSPTFYNSTYSEYQSTWGDNASTLYVQSNWTARGYQDFKSVDEYVAFPNVDTRNVQNDLMYAIESDIVNGKTTTVTLKHAQALINVNIKIDGEVPSGITHAFLAFVGGNVDLQSKMNISSTDSYSTMKDYLLNHSDGDLMSNLQHIASHAGDFTDSDMDALFPLKTIGSFIIDNRKNTPVVKWQFPKMKKVLESNSALYINAILSNQQTDIAFNATASVARTSGSDNFYTRFDGTNADKYVQVLGQLIPEQKTVNPWLFFEMNGKYYALEANLPKGTWQAGHIYTYNLIVNFAGPTFNVEVEKYTSPFATDASASI